MDWKLTRFVEVLFVDKFMKRAVDLAIENVEEGGQPFGAVIVKDNRIVAEGVNELHKHYDISGHAELLAIRQIQRELQTDDLSGYTMYASGEPCEMCLTAMYFIGIRDIYYCASFEEMLESGFAREEVMTYEDLKNLERSMKHMPLDDGYVNPIELWSEAN